MIVFLCSKPFNSSFSYPELKSNSFKCSKDLTCFVLSPIYQIPNSTNFSSFSSLQRHMPLQNVLPCVCGLLSFLICFLQHHFSPPVIPTRINLFKTESHPHPKLPILLYTPSPVHSTLIDYCIICWFFVILWPLYLNVSSKRAGSCLYGLWLDAQHLKPCLVHKVDLVSTC